MMLLFAHSKRRRRKGASVPFAGCITLSVCIAISNGCRRNHYTARLSHIISVLLIPLEFPTLLAMREIIANAKFYHNVNSESARVRNPSAKVQRISEIHSTMFNLLYILGEIKQHQTNTIMPIQTFRTARATLSTSCRWRCRRMWLSDT